MYYALFIYADEAEWTRHDEAKQSEVMSRHEELERDLRKAGKYVDCGGLHPTEAATTLRIENGKTLVTDGPYAETKEQLGGFYLVDAKDLDDALSIAKRIPVTGRGAIEIRPIAVRSLVA